jgi:hypothetical protein
MAELVVRRALLGVREHLVRFLGLLELGFRALVLALVAVRVVLHRELAISLLDFFIRGVLGDAQDFVIVSFGGHRYLRFRRNAAPDDTAGYRSDAASVNAAMGPP